jgi:chemotaxis signal transduction protein
MSRYLQASADAYRVLLDCCAVQEVGEWQARSGIQKEASWRDQTLPLANLAALLDGDSSGSAGHYVVLDTDNAALPRIMLLVENLSALVDVSDDAFQQPLAESGSGVSLYDVVHDDESARILLRLHPSALAQTLLAQSQQR